jgi:TRAP-type C4-dicarboxylate transport system permease small subunit
MERFLERYCRLLEGVLVILLAAMVLLVFGNVVLRYAFNSGISVSEEISRWLFVYLTFCGAIVALKEHAHLGTDMLISRLPPAGKKVCLALAHLIMLYVCWLLFRGSWQQMMINMKVAAPTTGAPVAIFYAPGVLFAVSAALMLVRDLVRMFAGRLSDAELVMVQESEDVVDIEQVLHEHTAPANK